jgi:hypothetical protein
MNMENNQDFIEFMLQRLHDLSSPLSQLILACERFSTDDEKIAKPEQWQRCQRSVVKIQDEIENIRNRVLMERKLTSS